MEEKHLMDIMIPLKDYAVVSQDATIRAEMDEIMSYISDKTFLERCKAQKDKKVRDFMTTVALSVDVNKGLGHALHIMRTSGHSGLLVTGEGRKPIGMLRLTDIYQLAEGAILENGSKGG